MLENISTQVTSASATNNQALLPGLDLMASLQVMLIQDYDNQLKFMQQTMKQNIAMKQAYRKDIEGLQKILVHSKTIYMKDKEYVKLDTQKDIQTVNKTTDYRISEKGMAIPTNQAVADYENGGKPVKINKDLILQNKSWGKDEDRGQTEGGSGTLVEKDKLEKKIEMLNNKLDQYNQNSELNSLQLQTLTNQRKIAFETLSNLVSKENETMNTIVRNVKG